MHRRRDCCPWCADDSLVDVAAGRRERVLGVPGREAIVVVVPRRLRGEPGLVIILLHVGELR
eukprot:3422767-Prymnesium_polylepis.1